MRMRAAMLLASLGVGLLPSCDLAPVYDPPHFLLPESYQGTGPFRVARPEDVLSPRGDWWTLLGDAQLNQLDEQLRSANTTLQAPAEQYTKSLNLAPGAQSELSPQ